MTKVKEYSKGEVQITWVGTGNGKNVFPRRLLVYKDRHGQFYDANILLVPTFWVNSYFDLYYDFVTISVPKNK